MVKWRHRREDVNDYVTIASLAVAIVTPFIFWSGWLVGAVGCLVLVIGLMLFAWSNRESRVLAAFLTAVGVLFLVLGVNDWAPSRAIDRALRRSEARLKSFVFSGYPRGLELPLSRLVIDPADADRLPADVTYFGDEGERFYAQKPQPGSLWRYRRTTEFGLAAQHEGLSEAELADRIPPEQVRILKSFRVHLWQRDAPRRISAGPVPIVLYPQVIVERFSLARLSEELIRKLGGSQPTAKVANVLRRLQQDPTANLLLAELTSDIESGFDPAPLVLLGSVQEVQRNLYADVTLVFLDVEVDGKKTARFYWRQELILLRVDDDVYLVRVLRPGSTPRSVDSSWTKGWLLGFHVVST